MWNRTVGRPPSRATTASDAAARGRAIEVFQRLNRLEAAEAWCRYLEAHARRLYATVTDRVRVAAALIHVPPPPADVGPHRQLKPLDQPVIPPAAEDVAQRRAAPAAA